jgi:hypothetical protein
MEPPLRALLFLLLNAPTPSTTIRTPLLTTLMEQAETLDAGAGKPKGKRRGGGIMPTNGGRRSDETRGLGCNARHSP